MLRIWLIPLFALLGGALLASPALAAKEDKEDIPEEGWYCVPDPADGGWACGIGEEPPIRAAAPPAGVRPQEDYTPEVRALPGSEPPSATPTSADSLFGSRPLTADDTAPGDAKTQETADAKTQEPAQDAVATSAAKPDIAEQLEAIETPQPSTGDYVIQLVGARDPANIDAFIERNQLEGQVITRQSWLYSEAWYIVLLGPYPDYETANLALERLPDGLRSAGPFVRTLSDIE